MFLSALSANQLFHKEIWNVLKLTTSQRLSTYVKLIAEIKPWFTDWLNLLP